MNKSIGALQILWICLLTQIVSLGFAILAFSFFEDPKLAGQLTGPLFLLSGALPLVAGLSKWLPFKSPAVLSSLIMTLVFSLPMLIIRYSSMGSDFEELFFFGIPAAQFHRLSGSMFLIVMACEIYQIWKCKKAQA